MPHINYRDKEIAFKIVYYGPGLSGKTTNLMYIHSALDKDRTGEIIVISIPLRKGRCSSISSHWS